MRDEYYTALAKNLEIEAAIETLQKEVDALRAQARPAADGGAEQQGAGQAQQAGGDAAQEQQQQGNGHQGGAGAGPMDVDGPVAVAAAAAAANGHVGT